MYSKNFFVSKTRASGIFGITELGKKIKNWIKVFKLFNYFFWTSIFFFIFLYFNLLYFFLHESQARSFRASYLPLRKQKKTFEKEKAEARFFLMENVDILRICWNIFLPKIHSFRINYLKNAYFQKDLKKVKFRNIRFYLFFSIEFKRNIRS